MEYIVFLFLKKLKFLIKVHSWITFHYSGEKKNSLFKVQRFTQLRISLDCLLTVISTVMFQMHLKNVNVIGISLLAFHSNDLIISLQILKYIT